MAIYLTPCLLSCLLCQASAFGMYESSKIFSPSYHLYWTVDKSGQTIKLGVVAKTLGWIGFGISPNGGMPNADMMVGWVDDKDGTVSITDRMSTAQTEPPVDKQQDWIKVAGTRNATHTTLEFSRPWDTKDAQDVPFTTGLMRIIWALGNSDTLEHHRSRGQAGVLFWGQSLTPPKDTLVFDIHMSNPNPVPAVQTTYLCQGLELPHDQKYQSVYYHPIVKNPDIVHHMLIYECDNPVDETVAKCDGMKKGCGRVMYAWAVGGPDMSFPPEAGYMFPQHAVLEIHYDNPTQKSGIVDSSGVIMYYTSSLRKHNIGTFRLGTAIPDINIPAKSPAYQSTRRCDLPGGEGGPGVTVFSSAVHMHKYGKQMWSVLYRDGVYQDTLARNLAWDFNIQEFKPIEPTVNVQGGDAIVTTCVWDTSSSSTPVRGGDASEDEMCLAILFYYPQVKNAAACYGDSMSIGTFDDNYPWEGGSTIPQKKTSDAYKFNSVSTLVALLLTSCFAAA